MRGPSPRTTAWLLVAMLALSLGWPLLVRPIFRGDTDLWYHLAEGRQFVETGVLQHESNFSFLRPTRTFIDYYWLFQWVTFHVYTLFGYLGLTVERAVLGVATLLTAAAVLRPGEHRGGWRALAVFGAILWMLSEVLLHRDSNLRPHSFGYLILAMFIWVLEAHPRKAWVLPPLALAWVNLHGISWPVLYVVCFASLAQTALTAWQEKRAGAPRSPLGPAPWVLLSLVTLWLTPHGNALVGVPFMLTSHAADYIHELRQLDWVLWDSSFDRSSPMSNLVTPVLFGINATMAVRSIVRREVRWNHLLMFLAGLYLMSKANRFLAELALLGLPYTHAFLSEVRARFVAESERASAPAALLGMVLVVLTAGAVQTWNARGCFPFSPSPLPVGASQFLSDLKVGGKVFHRPDYGGYLRWALPENYKLLMTLEVPFFFTDGDIYLSSVLHGTQGDLSRFLGQYEPEFLLIELNHFPLLAKVAKQDAYRPIFFDDNQVLFANRTLLPELVARLELQTVDPRGHATDGFRAVLGSRDRVKVLEELQRVRAAWPEGGLVNRWLSEAALEDGKPEAALEAARVVMRQYPNLAVGYQVAGDALRTMGRASESTQVFEDALTHVPTERWGRLERALAASQLAGGDARRAWATYRRAHILFASDTTAEDLWNFSSAAAQSGHEAEAIELLHDAELSLTPSEGPLRTKIEAMLKQVDAQAQ